MLKTIYSPDQKTFCDLLREQREAAGISQVEMGQRVGLEQTHVSRIERGTRRLDVLELRFWLECLDVDMGDFIDALEDRLNAPAVAKPGRLQRHSRVKKLQRK